MNADGIKELIALGEGINIEFKSSQFRLNKNAFESICSFLNRNGGHLLLGVGNDGTVEGVIEDLEESTIEADYPNLIKLLQIAKAHNCKWLVLDCDAEETQGLPKFDW